MAFSSLRNASRNRLGHYTHNKITSIRDSLALGYEILAKYFMLTRPVSALAYPSTEFKRDLRIDFLRGLIMLVVITVHLEYFSLFALFVWGRVGLVSSAEGFVAMSGLVVGIVYCKKLQTDGFRPTAQKLLARSFQLYRVNVALILSIALLGLLPFINVYEVTHWMSPGTRSPAYALYPPPATPWYDVLLQALLLKIGPHQFQVIGLYVVLMACARTALFFMHKKHTKLLLLVSWSVYLVNQIMQHKLTGARFEWAFPILTWQLLFFNCMAAGYHRQAIIDYFDAKKSLLTLNAATLISLWFMFMAFNNPRQIFWPWEPLSFIDPNLFQAAYELAFDKNRLGIGRVLNNLTLFIVAYGLLTRYWHMFNKSLGWLLIPLGQASLYVFIVHVYFVLLISNTPIRAYNNFYLNTLVHTGSILAIWLMVKNQILFKLIPR